MFLIINIDIIIIKRFIFGNFGKYAISDCLFICLSVCLSVIDVIQAAPFEQSTPNLAQIWNLFAGWAVYFLVLMTSQMMSSGQKLS